MAEWFEDESFWIENYPYMFDEERFAAAAEQVDQILALADFSGSSVLDLCCGPGRHAHVLAQKGLSVTAVDRTPFLLAKARERAEDLDVDVEWVQEDMRRFVRPAAFDLALSMFTSFGYFDDKADDLLVLENVHRSLKPGGTLVMDVVGKEWLAHVFQETTSESLPDGTLFVQRREIFDDWTRIRNEWVFIRGDRVRSYRFHHTIYSGQELKYRMLQAGFGEVRLCGGLDGSEYGRKARRLVAVARKPD